jgi:hypothetical protein
MGSDENVPTGRVMRTDQDRCPSGPELNKMVLWWRGDAGRSECTLNQIVALYMQTFPGRAHLLMLELVQHFVLEDAPTDPPIDPS